MQTQDWFFLYNMMCLDLLINRFFKTPLFLDLPVNRFFETLLCLGSSTHPFFKRPSIAKSQSIYSSKDNVFSRAYQSDQSIHIILSTFTLSHLKKHLCCELPINRISKTRRVWQIRCVELSKHVVFFKKQRVGLSKHIVFFKFNAWEVENTLSFSKKIGRASCRERV